MTLQNLLNFLLANWQNVVNFVQNFILSAISLIGNFWTIIQQKKDETLANALSTASTLVFNASNLLRTGYSLADNVIHGRVDKVIVDFLVAIQYAKETLSNALDLVEQTGDEKLTQTFNILNTAISNVVMTFQVQIDTLGLSIKQRIDGLVLEFNKIIDMSGLSLREKRELLKLFLDDPLGFIASVFFEIAIPILLYELAKGLTEATVDIGDPPVLSSKNVIVPSGSGAGELQEE